ncbi:putative metal chaperone YciC [Porphyridium purpureum]|uniref:Putative metal chaperone YciC n=1 Tax=Porphyridium purpureum TaxID=35688 RepID=A0A5J4Z6M4_PORPP|nr:putative metal chaperone YciC [Porphyridium purpureum]|eukprot:POR5686..scf295_1
MRRTGSCFVYCAPCACARARTRSSGAHAVGWTVRAGVSTAVVIVHGHGRRVLLRQHAAAVGEAGRSARDQDGEDTGGHDGHDDFAAAEPCVQSEPQTQAGPAAMEMRTDADNTCTEGHCVGTQARRAAVEAARASWKLQQHREMLERRMQLETPSHDTAGMSGADAANVSMNGTSGTTSQSKTGGGQDTSDDMERPERNGFVAPGISIVSGCDAALRSKFCASILANIPSETRAILISLGPKEREEEPEIRQEGTDRSKENIGVSSQEVVRDSSMEAAEEQTLAVCPQAAFAPLVFKQVLPELASAPAPQGYDTSAFFRCRSVKELNNVIRVISSRREHDYIIIEGSGAGMWNPIQLARELDHEVNVKVDCLVTVVDEDTFLRDLGQKNGIEAVTDGPSSTQNTEWAESEGEQAEKSPAPDSRSTFEIRYTPMLQAAPDVKAQAVSKKDAANENDSGQRAMMLVSLIEDANVVVAVSNGTPAPVGEKTRLESVVSTLNRAATIITAPVDQVPPAAIMHTAAYDPIRSALAATWRRALIAHGNEGIAKQSKGLKDVAFVYKSTRPFHPARLYERLNDMATFDGVLRSTGRLWLATRMRAPLIWAQAGDVASVKRGTPFWASVPEEQWPKSVREKMASLPQPEDHERCGDRESELVFVGTHLDKKKLLALLESCELNDSELVFRDAWQTSLQDPFTEFVPADDEEEDGGMDRDLNARVRRLNYLSDSGALHGPESLSPQRTDKLSVDEARAHCGASLEAGRYEWNE